MRLLPWQLNALNIATHGTHLFLIQFVHDWWNGSIFRAPIDHHRCDRLNGQYTAIDQGFDPSHGIGWLITQECFELIAIGVIEGIGNHVHAFVQEHLIEHFGTLVCE